MLLPSPLVLSVLLLVLACLVGSPEERNLQGPSLIQRGPPRIDRVSPEPLSLGQHSKRGLGHAAKHDHDRTTIATNHAKSKGDDVKEKWSLRFARWSAAVAAAFLLFLIIVHCIWLYSGTSPVADYRSELTNLVAVLIWLVVGTGSVMYWEGWLFTEATYVMVQILTTIGYGDIIVSASGMRLFMTFHVLCGVIIVSNTINDVSNYIQRRADMATVSNLRELDQRHASNHGDPKDVQKAPKALHSLLVSVLVFSFFLLTWVVFFSLVEDCTCSYGKTAVADCDPNDCAATGGFQIDPSTALYMGVVTMSTVGFGDFAPKTPLGRSIGMVWMFLGVLAFGNMVRHTAGAIGEGKKKLKTAESETNISAECFKKIDTDGSGSLSIAEYRAFVLIQRGLVSQEVMDAIDSTYNSLKGTHDEITYEAIQEFHKAH